MKTSLEIKMSDDGRFVWRFYAPNKILRHNVLVIEAIFN